MILDGDQIIYNDKILDPSFERSGYNCVWTDSQTDEWLMTVKDGIVTACSRTGGTGGWQLYSISRWSVEDGRKLRQHLEIEFEQNKNRQIYWDDIAMFCYPEEYRLGIYPMKKDDIIEIDNLASWPLWMPVTNNIWRRNNMNTKKSQGKNRLDDHTSSARHRHRTLHPLLLPAKINPMLY